MNKKRSEWANEEGSALVLTLMIFLVLTVLATSISFLTVGSFRLSDINRDGTSAFYIAEAGAKRAYEKASQEVMKTYQATTTTTSSNFYAALNDALFLNEERPFSFDKQFGDDATANVTFTGSSSNPGKYTLTSTGSVGGKTRTVQKQFDVSWVDKGGSGGLPALPSNTALITRGMTDIKGASLTGDIYTTSTGDGSFIIGNPSFKNTKIFFPIDVDKKKLFSYPDWYENEGHLPEREPFDSKKIKWSDYDALFSKIKIPKQTSNTKSLGNINAGGSDPYTLEITTKEIYIPQLMIGGYIPFILEPTYEDTVIFVDDWNTSAIRVEIKGDKKVTIVVKNDLQIGGTLYFNADKNKIGSPNQLNLIYLGNNHVTLPGGDGGLINANIIIEKATLSANTTKINGIIYSGGPRVSLDGSASGSKIMLIAPKAEVFISGSNDMLGTVIANNFTLNWGKLNYAPIDTSSFPVGSGGATSTPTLEDLLKSGPILEQ